MSVRPKHDDLRSHLTLKLLLKVYPSAPLTHSRLQNPQNTHSSRIPSFLWFCSGGKCQTVRSWNVSNVSLIGIHPFFRKWPCSSLFDTVLVCRQGLSPIPCSVLVSRRPLKCVTLLDSLSGPSGVVFNHSSNHQIKSKCICIALFTRKHVTEGFTYAHRAAP